MGTPIAAMVGGRNLALGSRSSMVEQEEAGEDVSHETSKIHASVASCKDGCTGVEMATLPAEVLPEELIGHVPSRSVDATNSLLLKRKSFVGNAPKPPVEKRRRKPLHVQLLRSLLLNRMLASPRTRHSRVKHLRSPSMIRDVPSSSVLPDCTRTTASPNPGQYSSRIVKRHKSIDTALFWCSSAAEKDGVGENEGDEVSKIQALASGCDGIHMETVPFEAVQEDAEQQGSMQHQGDKDAAARSVDRVISLLSKRKAPIVNASKPPERVQRMSSASHVQLVRSPVLNTMLQSPRMSPYRNMHWRSPSQVDRSLSARSSCGRTF